MFCKLHRWHVSRSLDDAQPLPKATARHVEKCNTCRQFHQDSLAVARRLTERPAPSPATVSPDLHDRILLRCGLARARSAQPHHGSANWRGHLGLPLALAVAAAAAMLAIAGARYFAAPEPTPPPGGPGPIATPNVPKPIVLPAVDDTAADFPVVVERAFRKPVEDELDLLRDDAKAAASFLLACIPAHIDLGEELPLWNDDDEKKSP